ncbi:cbb3-type cytochrome c oxidase N-terminal domain-containing protein [Acanthopleuribacter pedis]|uniref:C-type cytochrome n=1 Tax=Acanthopleuribacter pedis TaxID=442870 RepID=A0A8J7Q022_9BACT|nr:cbb3-type cytochrome c oxidase N-terminal domain-containing protein [Acanthopleuribacter pedis]MBO1317902.1 c-type cytochrome [Acanthopleuribacter pedis]
MVEDKKPLHQHDFDGIEENDNDLPHWWLGIFAVSILFACFYVPYYHFLNPEKLPHAALQAEMAAREAAVAQVAEQKAAEAPEDPEAALTATYSAGGWEESGKAVYTANCAACHANDGGGTIGPNFTDDYYIHGGKLSDLIRVVTEGVPTKGMISWKPILKPQQIQDVSFYVRAMRGTTPATPKEKQGELVDEAGNFVGAAEKPAE